MTEREATFWLLFAGLLVAITLYLFGAALPADAGDVGHTNRAELRFVRSDGRRGYTDTEVRMTIRAAVDRWPVPGGVDAALAVARCESGFETQAYNPAGYAGVYQQATAYWPGRYRALAPDPLELRPSVFSGRTNVVVSIRQAHTAGWGAWGCA